MAEKRTALEMAALIAWKTWGDQWAMSTTCSGCKELKPCRGKRRSKMLCIDCYDQGKA